MKRGRPRDEYPNGEFRGTVLGNLAQRSLSLRVLETLSGVNRGTLSAVLHAKRPAKDKTASLSCAPRLRAAYVQPYRGSMKLKSHFMLNAKNGLESSIRPSLAV